MSNEGSANPRGVSPASSGPAGPHFEAQIGASYLLAMLTGGEPRGLPGLAIDRIELQRASEGRPLDDVIVHAHDATGTAAVLEIQVKREVSFSPSDEVFGDVVQQIAAAARRPDFWTIRYELAVATGKTSARIAGPYQDVLTWARQLGSSLASGRFFTGMSICRERTAAPGHSECAGCAYRSSGVRPVRFAMRANIFGPISSSSWNANTKSGQFVRARVRCDPVWRLMAHPIFRSAEKTRRAFAEGHVLKRLGT